MWLPSMLLPSKSASSRGRRLRPHPHRGFGARIEALEDRALLSLYTGSALTPAQVDAAYGINLINFGTAANPIVGNGAGQTIAIMELGDDAALVNTGSPSFSKSDLHQFDVLAGLPDPPSFTVIGENGGPRPSYVGIVSSSESGNTVTITTSAPDGLSKGSSVTIAEDGQYDGTFNSINVVNSKKFTYTDSAQSKLASSSGGTINNPVSTGETTLDVEWAHAMAPAANIIVVEANTFGDMAAQAKFAAGLPGVSVVSMSWGGGEFKQETSQDADFTTPAGHQGVAFVLSSGDNGAPGGGYPVFSPNVLAAGATNLFINGDGSYQSETGWSNPVITSATEIGDTVTITTSSSTPAGFGPGQTVTISGVGVAGYNGPFTVTQSSANTFQYLDIQNSIPVTGLAPSSGGTAVGGNNGGTGGGRSLFESQPSYQAGVVPASMSTVGGVADRTIPDIAFVGGEATAVFTYNSDGAAGGFNNNYEFSTWGTSVSAPCLAGLIAIADQGLAIQGLPTLNTDPTLNTSPNLQTELYNLPSSDFHDITVGNNGYAAGPGYDLVSGIGTPVANLLIPDLVGTPAVLAYSTPDNINTGHNIIVQEVGPNIDVFDNGALVTSHPVSTTSAIDISGDDTAGAVNLTVDYSGGVFSAPVNFNGGTGSGPHGLTIKDGSSSIPNAIITSYAITNSTVTQDTVDGFGHPHDASITYSGLGSLTLNTGNVPNTVDVESTAAMTLVNEGAGTLAVTVSSQAENLDNLKGALGIEGNGTAPLIVSDQNNPNNSKAKYSLNGDLLTETGRFVTKTIDAVFTASITYGDIGSLMLDTASLSNQFTVQNTSVPTTINGGGGKDTYNIKATGASTSINLGAGNDTVNVGKGNLLMGIQAALTITGQGGLDTLNFNDQANTLPQSYFVNASIIYVRPLSLGVTYTGIGTVGLNGSQGVSTYNIQSTDPQTSYTVDAGKSQAAATFDISPFVENCDNDSTNLGLTLNGGGGTNTLEINDQNNPSPAGYNVNAGVIYVRPITVGISYSKITDVVLNGGQLGDTFNVFSTTPGTSYTLNGGSGGATFNVGSVGSNVLDDIQGPVIVNGQGGTSILNVNDQGSSGGNRYTLSNSSVQRKGTAAITYSDLNSLVANVSGGNAINLSGTAAGTATTLDAQDGSNTIRMNASVSAYAGPLTISGQTGLNTLSYAGFTGPVTVDLPLGVATGVAGGISNIVSVSGGSGNDLFVGNGQGNTLTGGSGRNLLIAGTGPGTLVGSVPNKGTLMVGGTTDYDTNLAALDAIMAEWSDNLPYATRVSALLSGGGDNGNDVLGATQFTNNGGGNTLQGNSPGQDLFYGIEALDTNDWQPSLGEDFIQNPVQVSFQIDARHLSEPLLLLDGSTSVVTQTPSTFEVAPGVHTLSDPYSPGASVSFTVRADGTVSYSSLLDGILGGETTSTLSVNGAHITFDAHTLSYSALQFDSVLSSTTATPFGFNLLPGQHVFQELYLSGSPIDFNVGDNGDVSYPNSDDDFLSGHGSNLTISGLTITINAEALVNSYLTLRIDTNLTDSPAAPFKLTVLPGPHTLADLFGQGSVQFSLDDSGDISYASSLDTVLSGQGSTTLTVNGAAVTINALALSDPELLFNNYTEQVSTALFTVYLLPGTATLSELLQPSDTTVTFSVAADGTVSYDPSLDSVFSGQGTGTLTVNGVTITVNARALAPAVPVLIVDTYRSETTAMPFPLTVLPGTQTISEPGTAANFIVALDGTVSYDPSLDSVFSGQGTGTLTINGVTAAVNAQAHSVPVAIVQTLQVLPGTVLFSDETLQFNVTLLTADQLTYPASVDSDVSGSGTNTLVVLA
jgi:hypothetical protein